MTGPAPPLWRQLQAAAAVLAAVRRGESATAALEQAPAELRAGAQALAFHALRQLGRAEALRRQLARRPPPPDADALLCAALALCWREDEAPYEVFTLVDQAVEAAKRQPATRGQANFINACLRRFLRERDALVATTDADPVARWNHPHWWIARLRRDYPHQWQDILAANNSQPPMTLRVNVRRSTRDAYLARLEAEGSAGHAVGEHGVILERPRGVHAVPGFDAGVVSVQDAAAQLAAPLLLHGLRAGSAPLRVLDACAAPGGKTGHLLELADAAVLALDVDPARCERIGDTLRRLGLQARVVAADAADPSAWWDGEPFDAILLDAPCTASGIVRRHPDVRWLRRESDIDRLAQVQARLLAVLWPLLKPGGRLLYCTCSVFREEGEAQARTFLAHNSDALSLGAPGHLLPQGGSKGKPLRDNQPGDHDGFYFALLEKAGPGRAAPGA
ncbi:16S rRNA (cytosine(967)-C(5))-methyltransferase RsmB [Ramlibacter sp. RBP-2]|uniref:16S rRNA (cytosine(967)-C(5))-methyltransferase n=1 Tax=Ramlibacter lithotrophicus TaxID=2606681 RepID=A0A7X6I7Z7_9BURK|nr:16S rRNA (cytosine(967)-C(5))-methyltransferase RsmB [Ramlibacter lithotrophicus]NKE67840.1 16S rRNA (cytosine(967)-C(5))-methyltransferase RsmB [Ramlibacter lithotrophicus]